MELSQRSKTNIDFENLFSLNTLTISTFPKYGSNPELINNMLRNDVLNDVSYKSGRVLGAMSTQPHFLLQNCILNIWRKTWVIVV